VFWAFATSRIPVNTKVKASLIRDESDRVVGINEQL